MVQRKTQEDSFRPILADQIIRLSSPHGQACYAELLRRVHYRDPEIGKE